MHELFFQVFDKGIKGGWIGPPDQLQEHVDPVYLNVGTDVIMDMADKGETKPDVELEEATVPHLLRVFPPALLGRIVTIPYFPLSTEVSGGITKLESWAPSSRKENHGAAMTVSPEVTAHIVDQCRDPDLGGRMVDNIIEHRSYPRYRARCWTAWSSRPR